MGLTVTENLNVNVVENVSVNDSMGLSEYISVMVVLVISLFSSLNATDIPSALIDINPSIVEQINITEESSGVIDIPGINVNESISLTDLVISDLQIGINSFDNIIISEQVALDNSLLAAEVFDQIIGGDVPSTHLLIDISAAEVLGSNDVFSIQISAIEDISISVFDQTVLLETTLLMADLHVAVFDTGGATDVAIACLESNISAMDQMVISDAVFAEVDLAIAISDDLILNELVQSAAGDLFALVFDAITAEEFVIVEAGVVSERYINVFDFARLDETVSAAESDLEVAAFDQVVANEYLQLSGEIYLNVIEQLQVTEAVFDSLSDLGISVSSQIVIYEAVTSSLGDLQIAVDASVILSESASAVIATPFIISEIELYSPVTLNIDLSSVVDMDLDLYSPVIKRLHLGFGSSPLPLYIEKSENIAISESRAIEVPPNINSWDNISIIDYANLDIAAMIIERTIGVGGDYSTVTQWFDAVANTDLVSQNVIERGILINDAEYLIPAVINKTAATGYSTKKNRFELIGNIGHNGSKNSGCRITFSPLVYLALNNLNIKFDNIVFKPTTPLSENRYAMFVGISEYLQVNKCIFDGFNGSIAGDRCYGVSASNAPVGSEIIITNSIFSNIISSGVNSWAFGFQVGVLLGSNKLIIANNSAFNIQAQLWAAGFSATANAQYPVLQYGQVSNNIGMNIDDQSTGTAISVTKAFSLPLTQSNIGDNDDYNYGTLVNFKDDYVNIFTDALNGDFTIIPGSIAENAGIDFSEYFTDNILGNTRTSWNIGAF